MDWIDELIDKLQDAVYNSKPLSFIDDSGNEILIEIKSELLELVKENRSRFIRIGINTFKKIMTLFSERKDFDALVVIYDTYDTSSLMDKYKEDTIKLAQIARQVQEDREFWISFAKQVGSRIVLGALGALI